MAGTSAAITAKIQGLREAKAAFQAIEPTFRERIADATEATVREIARGAQARLLASPSIQTRRLYDSVIWKMTRTNGRGRAGISDARYPSVGPGGVDRPSRRAHFVEFGTRKMHAEPFMMPAIESEKAPYLARVQSAGKQAERDLSTGRNL